MVTYFVVDEKERNKFEMEFQLPYGYHTVPHFKTEDGAIGFVDNCKISFKKENLIVEKWENGNCEVIYRSGWFKPDVYQGYENDLKK